MRQTRWNPFGNLFNPLQQFQSEMNRLFDRWNGNGGRTSARSTFPPVNLWEDDDSLYAEVELPGFNMSDLDIFVTGENQLSLKGERRQPELSNGVWHRQERGYGNFGRLIELPSAVDSDKVSAEFAHGILTITMPKREDVKPRKIQVRTA